MCLNCAGHLRDVMFTRFQEKHQILSCDSSAMKGTKRPKGPKAPAQPQKKSARKTPKALSHAVEEFQHVPRIKDSQAPNSHPLETTSTQSEEKSNSDLNSDKGKSSDIPDSRDVIARHLARSTA